jgi:hypothetical protein
MKGDTIMSLGFYLEYEIDGNEVEVFNTNVTHNLTKMANEAGVYKALWRPEEIEAVHAKDIVEILEKGLVDLKERPDHFRQFNPDNGWGSYKVFVPFVKECLEACRKYPNAKIVIWR